MSVRYEHPVDCVCGGQRVFTITYDVIPAMQSDATYPGHPAMVDSVQYSAPACLDCELCGGANLSYHNAVAAAERHLQDGAP